MRPLIDDLRVPRSGSERRSVDPAGPITVAVDATIVRPGQSGIRTYITGITRALAAHGGFRVHVFVVEHDTNDWGEAVVHHTTLKSASPYTRAVWREAFLPALIARVDADLVLVPSMEILQRCSLPQVAVVYDLGPIVAPGLYPTAQRLRMRVGLRATIRRAAAIVCISEATRTDVIRVADPRERSRVHVVGVGPQKLADPAAANRAKDGAIALYVGSSLRHKNLETLVEAFRSPVPGMPDKLVMVGPDYKGEVGRLMEGKESYPIEHRGFVSNDDLGSLYQQASCVVFPTLHEGFGIPVVEAMMRSVPVVASDIPALREVAGSAVQWVSRPTDPVAWQQALVHLGSDSGLAQELVDRGAQVVKRHTWEAAAVSMGAVIRDVLEDGHSVTSSQVAG